jgi:hypothetical protein
LILPPLSPFDTPILIQPPQTSHPYSPPSHYPSLDLTSGDEQVNELVNEMVKNSFCDDFFNIPSIALLNPDESYAYALTVRKKKSPEIHPLSIAAARSLGNIEVNWSASMGEHARTCSEEILIGKKVSYLPTGATPSASSVPQPTPSSTSTSGTLSTRKSIETLGLHGTGIPPEQRNNTLYIEAIQVPNEGYVGKEFQILIRLTNYYSYPILSQIQHRYDMNLHQLMVTGLATMNVGALDAGESTQLTLSILPLNSGLQSLNGVIAVDLTTKLEFPMNNLFQIMIFDDLVSKNIPQLLTSEGGKK